MLVATDPYIDESKQGAKLLIEYPIQTTNLKRKLPMSEPRPRGRPRKVAPTKQVTPNASHFPTDIEDVTDIHVKGQIMTSEADTAMSATEVGSKIYEQKRYDEAIANPIHSHQWREAIEEELQNLEQHSTWEYDELPSGRVAIGSKWVFRVKYHPDGLVARYKARLVAQEYSQIPGIDFNKTFAPTVRRESLRIFLVISALFEFLVE